MRRFNYLIVLTLLTLGHLFAQGGSAYSYFGIGDILHDYSIKRSALGGFATAANDNFDINSYNPAAWTSIKNIYLSTSVDFTYIKTSDFSQKSDFNNFQFQSVKIGIPIYTDYGITASLGISPYSRINYNIIKESSFEQTPFKVIYNGYGGINKFNLGTSFISPFGCSVGLNLNYYNGTIYNDADVDVNNANTFYNSFSREKVINGFGVSLGYISPNLNDFLKLELLNSLKLSFVLNSPAKLNTVENTLKNTFVLDTIVSNKYDIEIPFSFGVGLGGTFEKRYNFYLDYFQQNWSNFRANGLKDDNLNNSFIFSGGFEILPIAKPEHFTETFTYRFGLFYKQSEFIVANTKILEYGLSAGMTVPFDARNGIDFAIQFTNRGTKDNSLQRDNLFRFLIGISFSDLWFVREED